MILPVMATICRVIVITFAGHRTLSLSLLYCMGGGTSQPCISMGEQCGNMFGYADMYEALFTPARSSLFHVVGIRGSLVDALNA